MQFRSADGGSGGDGGCGNSGNSHDKMIVVEIIS